MAPARPVLRLGRLTLLGSLYLLTIAALLVLSALTGFSAAGEAREGYIQTAFRLFGLGVVAFAVGALIPPHWVGRLAPLAYLVVVALLIQVSLRGTSAFGARRWLSIGGFSFEPSEIAKPVLLVLVIWMCGLPWIRRRGSVAVALSLLVTAPTIALVALQPDLGTAIFLAIAVVVALFFSGLPWRYFIGSGVLLAVAVPFVYTSVLHAYQRTRIEVFLDPARDPLGAGWNVMQSRIAVGSGGLHGRGLLGGTQSQLGFLPVQESDFVFATLVEEQGFIGALAVGVLLVLLVVLLMLIAARVRSRYGSALAASAAVLIGVQASVAMAMNVGLAPVVGIPLPFLARGGSSLVATLFLLGLVEGIRYRESPRTPEPTPLTADDAERIFLPSHERTAFTA